MESIDEARIDPYVAMMKRLIFLTKTEDKDLITSIVVKTTQCDGLITNKDRRNVIKPRSWKSFGRILENVLLMEIDKNGF